MKRLFFGLMLLCAPALGHAQWAMLPNGEWGYSFGYTTSVQFFCGQQQAPGACSGGNNALTITNGDAYANIVFTGVPGTSVASNVRAFSQPIGSFSLTFGGVGSFTWPGAANIYELFGIRYVMTQTGPGSGSGSFSRRYRRSGTEKVVQDCCEGDRDYLSLGTLGQPPQLRYQGMIWDNFTFPTFDVNGPREFTATAAVGLVPEPSTYALFAVGLLAIGVVRRKRT